MERLTITRSPAPPRGFADSARVYLRPVGLGRGDAAARAVEAEEAFQLAGGGVAFTACEVVWRTGQAVEACWLPVSRLLPWRDALADAGANRITALIERLCAPRGPVAGMALDTPRIMGIVNVTPDSFSDGGRFADADTAIERGLDLARFGADIVDVGGESTRPGAEPIDERTEQERALPVVRGLAEAGLAVSIDTRNPATMRRAAESGARLINDVTALTHAADSVATVAEVGLPVILMHSAGDPRVMQDSPVYDHAALDVYDSLAERVEACVCAGVSRDSIVVDPGFGFGKTVEHNLRLVNWAAMFHGLGCPLLVGASRKSTIARIAGESAQDASARLQGSLVFAQSAWDQGVQIVRVHDVAETAQALAIWRALGAA